MLRVDRLSSGRSYAEGAIPLSQVAPVGLTNLFDNLCPRQIIVMAGA
jgi:hypothetical protein